MLQARAGSGPRGGRGPAAADKADYLTGMGPTDGASAARGCLCWLSSQLAESYLTRGLFGQILRSTRGQEGRNLEKPLCHLFRHRQNGRLERAGLAEQHRSQGRMVHTGNPGLKRRSFMDHSSLFRGARIRQLGRMILLSLGLSVGLINVSLSRAGAEGPVTSDALIPFTGAIFDSQTNSNITLNGCLQIVSRWRRQSSGDIQITAYANLRTADVIASTDTGFSYIALGAGHTSIRCSDPCHSVKVSIFGFDLRLSIVTRATVSSTPTCSSHPVFDPGITGIPSPLAFSPGSSFTEFGFDLILVFSDAGILDTRNSTVLLLPCRDCS